MTFLYIILGIFVGATIGFIIFSLIFKKNKPDSDLIAKELNKSFPDILKKASEQLIIMADQKLGAEKQEIKTDLTNKKSAIEDLVKRVLQELKESSTKLEQAEIKRVGSFKSLKTALDSHQKITEQLSVTTEGLKKVLSNNQLRGAFGEKVADDLLKMSGFVRGVDYEFNKKQTGSTNRPDFSIFLPDGVRINVDAKFPYASLQKMSETKNQSAKKEQLKLFKRDVKEKIKQISTRDYINPDDNTVDFVILFVPNEMIFSFIYDQMGDIWEEAMRQKVILAGPFSFSAILRMLRQAYDNFKYQKNTQNIITYIKNFEKEFVKYNQAFQKVGDRLSALSKQYDVVNSTRTRQLLRIIDKIHLESDTDKKLLN
ncbi:DNA recombination protein RmuC [Patescibacteria group bacterium]|nr:DNA recombination protein RmuC [Patescibacteria group bacterium]MCG2701573.1 DNA recombination protein RmuC [Candidatus Parcubacteria bacterium]MBU4264459.1 DNA recombination protein RmuC [Patescibacteria group bacterium]MBU4390390.1 DNA recombination protein RmuC [Patescibacteria group bacterium]MBU4396661.1 DNA recombination protein RmuC [Patescibacteria group bacterium]